MKVTYLRLHNFNAIYSTLNRKTIEIDFLNMKHRIMLFVGTNGSCKTYILSNIHPFAHVGTVDARSGQDMIIDGKDGEKEIHFEKDGDVYVVHHHYKYNGNRSRKVSSYIMKNGEELNPSGLVTKFNELIWIEFGIDPGFLRVIRLGSNVNNLVALKSTDRKEFAVSLLSEVDEYISDFKKVSKVSNTYKIAIKSVVEKLKKLSIDDIEIHRKSMESLAKKIESRKGEFESTKREFFTTKGKVEGILNGKSVHEFMDEVSRISFDITRLKDDRRKCVEFKSRFRYVGHGDMTSDSFLHSLERRKQSTVAEMAECRTAISYVMKSIDETVHRIDELETKRSECVVSADIDDTRKRLDEKLKFRKQYKKYYENFDTDCTVDMMIEYIEKMKLVYQLILGAMEFSIDSRKMYIELKNDGKDIHSKCVNKLVALSTELSMCDNVTEHDTHMDKVPSGCTRYKDCYYYKLIHKTSKRNKKDIEDDIETVKGCLKVLDIINEIETIIKNTRKEIPDKVKLVDIETDILNGTMTFFDFTEGNNRVKFLDTFNRYKENDKEIDELEHLLEVYSNQNGEYDTNITMAITEAQVLLKSHKTELDRLNKRLSKVVESDERIGNIIDDTIKLRENKKAVSVLDNDISLKEKELESMLIHSSTVKDFIAVEREFNREESEYTQEIKQMEDEMYTMRVKMEEYEKLTIEKKELDDEFEATELIRNAVSSSRGIPLLYLNLHFGNARNIANAIISSVYGDAIHLERFIINEKEFRIPYSKNGSIVEDVSYASQGELSVISLAISFALLEEFSSYKYNVLLLDEVDGPLDKGNKEKFLRVLETQMERINCEQVFMITHNQLFETYPVDVYVTIDKDNALEEFKNVNVLKG